MKLSDDELMFVSLMSNQPWRSPLPTIVMSEQSHIIAAGLRGRRSLMIRDLISEDDELDNSLQIVLDTFEAKSVDVTLICDQQLERTTWTLSTTHYPVEDYWIMEAFDETGIHSFEILDNAERVEAVLAVLKAAGDTSAIPGRPDEEQLVWIRFGTGEIHQAISVKAGEIYEFAVVIEGERLTPKRNYKSSSVEAITEIIAQRS